VGLRGLAVEVNGGGVTVQCPPGLDTGAVDSHRGRSPELRGHGRRGQTVSQPLGIHLGVVNNVAGVKDIAQLVEGAVHPRIGLAGVILPGLCLTFGMTYV
jgi:hypothetical protein